MSSIDDTQQSTHSRSKREQAQSRGVYKGRAKALTDEQLAQAREWVDAGVPKAEVARRLGIGRTTLYSYLDKV